jgi:hypothetical protein
MRALHVSAAMVGGSGIEPRLHRGPAAGLIRICAAVSGLADAVRCDLMRSAAFPHASFV